MFLQGTRVIVVGNVVNCTMQCAKSSFIIGGVSIEANG